jgi:5-methyltetrahydrofolate--homocysteine methyltransferase
VFAPESGGSGTSFVETTDLETRWTDLDYRMRELENELDTTCYLGDAFPLWQNFVAAGALASILGNPYTFAKDTVWVDQQPSVRSLTERNPLQFNEDSPMWKLVSETTEYFSRRAGTRFQSGITDIGGGLDTACALRGTEDLLVDLMTEPEAVDDFLLEIDRCWFECYERLQTMIARHTDVIGSWMPIWCPERWYALQADTSAMISPALFERFVKPGLVRQADFLDRSIYHLDGPSAIRHLDHVLDIDRIQGIEWVGGPYETVDRGGPQWYPMFRKIQEKGRNLVIRYVWPQSVIPLLENFSHKGLFISTECASRQQAEDLMREIGKIKVRG